MLSHVKFSAMLALSCTLPLQLVVGVGGEPTSTDAGTMSTVVTTEANFHTDNVGLGNWDPLDGIASIGEPFPDSDGAFVDGPVMLLNTSVENTQLVIEDAGIALLRAIGSTKLAVIVTAGPARSGKSFLVNNLLAPNLNRDGQSDRAELRGFQVGHSGKAQTKGVWLWGRPRRVKHEGEDLAVVLVDTEGFGALGNNANAYDPKLCALAIAFASSFIYNIDGLISMANIHLLRDVAKMDEVFRQRFNEEFPLPPPFWVVQGYPFQDLDEYDPPNAEGYLNYAYSQKASQDGTSDADAYNEVIQMILRKFPHQEAPRIMLMADPRNGARRYELAQLGWAEYDAAYQADIVALRSIIASRIRSKRLHGAFVTGTFMASLVLKLVPQLNELHGDATDLIRNIATIIAEECFDDYKDSVDTKARLPSAPEVLESAHVEAEADSITSYNERVNATRQLREHDEPRDMLVNNISYEHRARQAKNLLEMQNFCEEVLVTTLSDLQNMVVAPHDAQVTMSKQEMESMVEETLKAFDERCFIPEPDKRLRRNNFVQSSQVVLQSLDIMKGSHLKRSLGNLAVEAFVVLLVLAVLRKFESSSAGVFSTAFNVLKTVWISSLVLGLLYFTGALDLVRVYLSHHAGMDVDVEALVATALEAAVRLRQGIERLRLALQTQVTAVTVLYLGVSSVLAQSISAAVDIDVEQIAIVINSAFFVALLVPLSYSFAKLSALARACLFVATSVVTWMVYASLAESSDAGRGEQ